MKQKKKMLVTLLITAAILLCFMGAVRDLEKDRQALGRQQLEEVLRRTAVTCYTAEGFYPPSLDYMRRQYGLQYDETQYVIYYEIFASNLMPSITVLEK